MVQNYITISFGLPSQNEVIKNTKKHWSVYAGMKKKNTEAIRTLLHEQDCIPETPYERIDLECVWIESGRTRDPDNIMCGGLKPILDAMVKEKVIVDDSIKQVNRITSTFEKGKERAVIVKWSECMAEVYASPALDVYVQELEYHIHHIENMIEKSESSITWLEGQKSGFEYALALYKEETNK